MQSLFDRVNKRALLIALLSFISALTLNELNQYHLKADGISLRDNQTVITSDDISYLRPAINLIEQGELKDNTPGAGSCLVRSPGYSLIISTLIVFFGQKKMLLSLIWFQLLLFSFSVYLFYLIAEQLLTDKRIVAVVSIVFGVSGMASGFLFYTLTEGVTPALVISLCYLLIRAKNCNQRNLKFRYYLITALIFSFLFITRPVLGIYAFPILIYLLLDYRNSISRNWLKISLLLTIMFGAMIILQIRNYIKTGQYTGLYPIYYPENSMTCFRPTHQAWWEFCKSWGMTGQEFHSLIVPIWNKTISDENSTKEVANLINAIPSYAKQFLGRESIEQALVLYLESIRFQKEFYNKAIAMPKEIPEIEIKCINAINALTHSFREKFWFQFHIIAPIKVFKNLAFHSNLSLYIFQKTFRNNPFMEIYRWLCFLLHTAAFLLLFFGIFTHKSFDTKVLFTLTSLIYVFYLVYVQRGIEERYTLPILGAVLLNLSFITEEVLARIKQQKPFVPNFIGKLKKDAAKLIE